MNIKLQGRQHSEGYTTSRRAKVCIWWQSFHNLFQFNAVAPRYLLWLHHNLASCDPACPSLHLRCYSSSVDFFCPSIGSNFSLSFLMFVYSFHHSPTSTINPCYLRVIFAPTFFKVTFFHFIICHLDGFTPSLFCSSVPAIINSHIYLCLDFSLILQWTSLKADNLSV